MSAMTWPHCEHSMSFPREYFFPPSPQSIFFFLRRPTSASDVSPVLSFTNVEASYDTESCAAPVILSV